MKRPTISQWMIAGVNWNHNHFFGFIICVPQLLDARGSKNKQSELYYIGETRGTTFIWINCKRRMTDVADENRAIGNLLRLNTHTLCTHIRVLSGKRLANDNALWRVSLPVVLIR